VFCAQDIQTGVPLRPPESILRSLEESFAGMEAQNPARDLAFYGGTFTALPRETQNSFLAVAARLKREGKIRRVRCSTRPDAVSPRRLAALRRLGLDDLELGIQSFCDLPLRASRRGYSGTEARAACLKAREAGLGLGVQLMPGMPGMEEKHLEDDVEQCLELRPDTVRLYPCLVLAGTALAREWEEGAFLPWSLERICRLLPRAILALWGRGIRVIRLGLAPEKNLKENLLAGAWHPSLGQSLRGRALQLYLSSRLPGEPEKLKGKILCAPRRAQGEFFGHRRELRPSYAAMGLEQKQVRWWNNDFFELLEDSL
jgi:histone acetyltransferase (RNA polymerase elongator complex component)